ncbi:MAG: response regulator transcription factor [Anaerolineales bacterium]|nr:response regulator transcription factor [Anaerolineales bacterium]
MDLNFKTSTFSFASPSPKVSGFSAGKDSIRVLIADDHPRSRRGLRALLTTWPGVKVVGEAADGQEAVHLVETQHPDVVLMDANMPVMDGLEATRQIKEQWPHTKIILLTVYNGRRAEAFAAGIDVFLAKGCPIDMLYSAILPSPDGPVK